MKRSSPIHHRRGMRNGFGAGISALLFLLLLAGTMSGSSAGSVISGTPMQVREPITPSVSVVLNGFRSTPEALSRFSGQDLHYVVDAQALKEGAVYVFMSPAQRDAFLQFRSRAGATHTSLKSTAGPTATFWEHPNRTGQVKQYSTSVLSLGAWSDVISSLETGTKNVRLWEHEGFRGASFTVPADVIVEDLRPFGWSDVASSLQFF